MATPSEIVEGFRNDIANVYGAQVVIRDHLTMGKSGAFVAIVECSGELDGIHVLKIDRIVSDWIGEEERHKEVVTTGAFSGKVPKIVLSIKSGNYYCILIELAGHSRLVWRPLVADHGLFCSAYGEFAKISWTPALFTFGEQQTSGEVIASALGYRLSKENGGRIEENISKYISADIKESSMFIFRGEVLPNPLYFTRSNRDKTIIRPLLGPVHGDCHGQNVFVKAGEDARVHDINLIDFATYHSSLPFFFDHAYLELATLLRRLDGLGYARWYKLVDALATENITAAVDPSERGWLEDIIKARKVANDLAFRQYNDRQDDLRLQMLLVQVSAGLAFLHKRPRSGSGSAGLTANQYVQSLIWASVFLKRYFSLVDIQMSDLFSGDVAVALPSKLGKSSDPADPKALASLRFANSSFNILVVGSSVGKLPQDIVVSPWTFVIDFRTLPPIEAEQIDSPKTFRQSWPGQPFPDLKILRRGGVWYFANGRSDLSDALPTSTPAAWRRQYRGSFDRFMRDIAVSQAPADVRCLILPDGLSVDVLQKVIETIDTEFHAALAPLVVADLEQSLPDIDGVELRQHPLDGILAVLSGERSAAPSSSAIALLPQRTVEGVRLAAIPEEMLSRVSRDLSVVYRARAQAVPEGRAFGADFRRGMPIEWAELAQHLDVPRVLPFELLQSQIKEAIDASSNRTVNLLHEPSAGGTTLARRLAWTFMEQVPTVIVDQVSNDTSSYLRDIFQFSSLPLLVILEGAIVTESEREGFLQQLREDNVRAVFLWVSRGANRQGTSGALSSELNDDEVNMFLDAYLEQTTDPSRISQLRRLASAGTSREYRNPFFFGLTAFGEGFIGVDKLIDDVLRGVRNDAARELLADLTIVSLYNSEGFPTNEYDELCRILNDGHCPVDEDSLFILRTGTHIRVSHALLARLVLTKLARVPEYWRADISRFSMTLLSHLNALRSTASDRVKNLVNALFITRDMESAIQADVDASVGGIPSQRRFSPLINDLGNAELARTVFRRITQIWPREPHYAAHLARHLMYEDPRDIDGAVAQAEFAARMPEGESDAALVHVAGMAHRVRMEQLLKAAELDNRSLTNIESEVKVDYDAAIERFGRSTQLKPSSEHGLVATIQTVSSLIRHSIRLAGVSNLAEFLRSRSSLTYIDALYLAEDCIYMIRNRPRISIRAERTIAEWNIVYGDTDRVVSELRVLTSRHEDVGLRRALCVAIVARYKHDWQSVSQNDLRTVARMMEQNIRQQGVQDSDIRRWFLAYRHLTEFDESLAIQRLIDWHGLNPKSVEPPYYLVAINLLRWLKATASRDALAGEINRWIEVCQKNRPYGSRSWSYEWLEWKNNKHGLAHFRNDLEFDPPSMIKMERPQDLAKLESRLARVEGTLRGYRGPQSAVMDLGSRLYVRITPLDRLSRDDEGKRISAFLSFTYDGLVGWDPRYVRR